MRNLKILLDSICKRLWLTPCIPYIRHVNNITAFLVIINKVKPLVDMIGTISFTSVFQERFRVTNLWKLFQIAAYIFNPLCKLICSLFTKLLKALDQISIEFLFCPILPFYLSHSSSFLKSFFISSNDFPCPCAISASTSSMRAFSSSIV